MLNKILTLFFVFSSFSAVLAQDEAEAIKIICDIDEVNTAQFQGFKRNLRKVKRLEKTAFFEVTYIDVPEKAKRTIDAALDTWSELIISKVPIRVLVNWVGLGARSLASAGATKVYRNSPGLPFANTWYVGPLAESILGKELNSGDIDIEIKVNSSIKWHFNDEVNIQIGEYDLETIMLHEIAHALGISSSIDVSDDGKKAFWGGTSTGTKSYYIFDYFIENADRKQIVNENNFVNNSELLKNQVTSNSLVFGFKRGAKAGTSVKLYAPSTYSKGSSISHFDERTYAILNLASLMTPVLSTGEIILNPGDLLLTCLLNIGWKLNIPEVFLQVDEATAYPNPIFDQLYIQLPSSNIERNTEILLISPEGKLLLTSTLTSKNPFYSINFERYPNGFYLLQIKDGETITTKRIVK